MDDTGRFEFESADRIITGKVGERCAARVT
jgi:hypothetical protein